jgi:hypothetical protein
MMMQNQQIEKDKRKTCWEGLILIYIMGERKDSKNWGRAGVAS